MPRQPNTDLSNGIETRTCGRCDGSGNYSFNLMDGTRCYGCGGSGVIETARGRATRHRFLESVTVDASEVQNGWVARGQSGKWFVVSEVTPERMQGASLVDGVMVPYDRKGMCITYGKTGHVMLQTTRIEAQPSMESVRAKLRAAYEFQQTLTESGRPAKASRLIRPIKDAILSQRYTQGRCSKHGCRTAVISFDLDQCRRFRSKSCLLHDVGILALSRSSDTRR